MEQHLRIPTCQTSPWILLTLKSSEAGNLMEP